MLFLYPAAFLTATTFAVAILWRLVLVLFRRSAPGFWGRTFRWHMGLLLFHLFVTVPVALGAWLPGAVGTRGDESAYAGPRLGEDGSWQLQSRESLRAERDRGAGSDASDPPASPYEVGFTARDGVRLRGFLVPPRDPGPGGPRFEAVLVHGLFRGALELETPASMLRDLGGEVLLLELRNHGGSGRAQFTLGRDEALDVAAAASFLTERPGNGDRPLILFAVSLGTAAAGIAAPGIEGLDGLILDAPMDDAASTARRGLVEGPFMRSIRDPWATELLLSAHYLGGVPLADVHPREALRHLSPDVAVLLIGAGHDGRMPPDTVRATFEALPTPAERKRLWIEPEATHGKVWVAAPEEYRRHLAWLCDEAAGPVGEPAADGDPEPHAKS